MTKTNEFAMVLSGGGAKGAYQVGVFRAFQEYPIRIECVSGSSIGGINGYAYATLTQERIEELWKGFSLSDFINPDDDWSDGISDRTSLERILDEIVSEELLKDAIPIYNTICEDETKAEYVKLNDKSKDEAVKTILATSALPIIYSKVNINGVEYQDGGVADNLPVLPLYLEGYRDMIVVGLSENLRIDKMKFPTENLIEIFPSYSLGDLFDGTLNFSKKFVSYAMKLGYADAKRALNDYYGLDNGCHTAEFDYNQILHEIRAEDLERDINSNMDKLMKYF